MSDLLDLDQLSPEPKKVKIQGKVLEVNPPRLKQLIKLIKLFSSLENIKSKDDIDNFEKIMDELKYIAPGIEEFDLTIDQMKALIEFAIIQSQIPQEAAQKKGVDSPNS